MRYQAEISRINPTCFLFLIDQSTSMLDPWGGAAERRKADALATIINRLIGDLVIRCSKEEGVRNYFEVGVLGYGGHVGPAFGGQLAGQQIVPISTLAEAPLRVEDRKQKVSDGVGGLVEQNVKFPVWFDPVANGNTPMCEALDLARGLLAEWIGRHPAAFPPTVINITDGEATDGDPVPLADALRMLSTTDGTVLLFNVHLSSARQHPIEYPDTDANLPDQYARQLFRMSSVLPPHMQQFARADGLEISELSRGFVFNANEVSLVQFLDIGTRPANLR